jgi:hypothetical protein
MVRRNEYQEVGETLLGNLSVVDVGKENVMKHLGAAVLSGLLATLNAPLASAQGNTTSSSPATEHSDPIVRMHRQVAAANRVYDQKVAAAKKVYDHKKAEARKERDAAIKAAHDAAGQ